MSAETAAPSSLDPSLDPADWAAFRAQGHRMLDDMVDHMAGLREQPLWRAPTPEARAAARAPLPLAASELAEVHGEFLKTILPHHSGNAHPGFMGWVQGGGTPVGMLAEMLAAGMNANCGGRDHMALEIERQVLAWSAELFGFPDTAGGLIVTGTSQANVMGVLLARTRALGPAVRERGVGEAGLIAYASTAAHGCVAQAMEMAGLGSLRLRRVPTGADHRIRLDVLEEAIRADRRAGLRPFLMVGNAGAVDVGAIDDLAALATLAGREDIHFHVDGAFGALAALSPALKPRLDGLERADSIAFDWHKWGQVPYDAGVFLARDADLQRRTFAADAAYLRRAGRGLAGGDWWPCDHGPDLSRSFRALKVWFTLKTHGVAALGAAIERTVALAGQLAERVRAEPVLELLAPVPLNIVCFGVRAPDADRLNAEIVEALHEEGRVAPSLTTIGGRTAIRAAIVNHRTGPRDIEALVASVLRLARRDGARRAA